MYLNGFYSQILSPMRCGLLLITLFSFYIGATPSCLSGLGQFKGIPHSAYSPGTENRSPFVRLKSISEGYENRWLVSPRWQTTSDISKGDVLEARVRLRLRSGPKGKAHIVFRTNEQPNVVSLYSTFELDTARHTFTIPFRSMAYTESGQAYLGLGFGSMQQTVEIESVVLYNHGRSRTVESFDYDPFHGQSNEAWRDRAKENIDRIRKANMAITVRDSTGAAHHNCTVSLKMIQHQFGFGGLFNFHIFRHQHNRPGDVAKYLAYFPKYFNYSTVGWGPMWRDWENQKSFITLQGKAVEWLNERRIPVIAMSNALIQPIRRFYPERVFAAMERGEYKRYLDLSSSYLKKRVSLLSDVQVDHWIGTNEYVSSPFFPDKKVDLMQHHFQILDSIAPNATLGSLEHKIIGERNCKYEDQYFVNIKNLIDRGVQLSRIGFQGRFKYHMLTPPDTIQRILDRFAELNIPLQIHEFEIVHVYDSTLLYRYTRDLLTVTFSHPSMREFLFFTFWSHIPEDDHRALFRHDWTPTPMGRAFLDLVHGEWKTNVEGPTDDRGRFTTDAFLGDYEIRVCHQADTLVLHKTLNSSGLDLDIVF